MTKDTHDFETWYETLQLQVAERTGVKFTDEDSVTDDYENGRNVFDVIDEIAAEYGDTEGA